MNLFRHIEKTIKNKLNKQKLAGIKLLAMDFDGVHTDGFVYLSQDGTETVRCDRRDGLGIEQLKQTGIKLCVISKEANPVVMARCVKIGIECFQSIDTSLGKKEILEQLASREKIDREHIAFMGDDVNDLDALIYAGLAITVANGHDRTISVADIVLTKKGGEGAVRELCDLIIQSRMKLNS